MVIMEDKSNEYIDVRITPMGGSSANMSLVTVIFGMALLILGVGVLLGYILGRSCNRVIKKAHVNQVVNTTPDRFLPKPWWNSTVIQLRRV